MMSDPSPKLPDDTLIADLKPPTRIRNALVGGGVRTMGDVREMPDATSLSFQDLGTESLSQIARCLDFHQVKASVRTVSEEPTRSIERWRSDPLRILRVTQNGKQWIANLYAHVFSKEHRRSLYWSLAGVTGRQRRFDHHVTSSLP
jgi:hypothetical protein